MRSLHRLVSDVLGPLLNTQDLAVTLSVTDDPGAPAEFQAGRPIPYRAQASIPYAIVPVSCAENTPPTAVLAGPPVQQVFGFPQSLVAVSVDGTLSHDAETPIDAYNVNCGNGSIPVPSGSPGRATCRYLVDIVPHTYAVTLIVVDRGTGQIVDGQYQCQKESTPVSFQVVVAPLSNGP